MESPRGTPLPSQAARPRAATVLSCAAALLGSSLAGPTEAAELVDLVVAGVTRPAGKPDSVTPSCLLLSGEAPPAPASPMRAPAGDVAALYLDQLERFDPQRASAQHERLAALLADLETVTGASLDERLVSAGAVAGGRELELEIATRSEGLGGDGIFEVLAAWVREEAGAEPRAWIDGALWEALDAERRGLVLVQLLAQAERAEGPARSRPSSSARTCATSA